MCGNWVFTDGTCDGTGWLSSYRINSLTQTMIVGFSNGGGAATFGNWVFSGAVTKAVAIDYHAHTNMDNWLEAWCPSTPCSDGLALKVYYSCGSNMYQMDNDWDWEWDGPYTVKSYGPSDTFETYPPHDFLEWSWTGAG